VNIVSAHLMVEIGVDAGVRLLEDQTVMAPRPRPTSPETEACLSDDRL
jgi:hypothetical protein